MRAGRSAICSIRVAGEDSRSGVDRVNLEDAVRDIGQLPRKSVLYAAEAVAHYAEYDAYLPAEEE